MADGEYGHEHEGGIEKAQSCLNPWARLVAFADLWMVSLVQTGQDIGV